MSFDIFWNPGTCLEGSEGRFQDDILEHGSMIETICGSMVEGPGWEE